MARISLEEITAPISDEQPCGPDLDMEFDMDFMNFVAEIDGKIPTAFFSFEPGSLDYAGYYDRVGDILARTRDLRVLVPLAKLRILQSDIAGFAEVLDAMHRLLRERWSDLHPQPAEFLELGMGQLATLDDMPNVILPLQHAPLVRSRRAGAITLRKWQVATGGVNARDGEETLDAATIIAALADADADERGRSAEALARARGAVAGIRTVCMQEAGYDKAPSLERLPAAIEAALGLIETATGGAAASADDAPAGGVEAASAGHPAGSVVGRLPLGTIGTREQAVEAMHVAARYFALREPSSPVPILLREAQTASAKSFYELVSDLVPDSAGSAFVSLGAEPWFEVYLSTLDTRNPPPDYETEAERHELAEDAGLGAEDAAAAADPVPADDPDMHAEDASDDEVAAAAGADGDAAPEGEPEADAAADDAGSVEDAPAPAPEPASAQPRFVAGSRPEAVALMQQVLEYYRVAEPSSPVPLLVERAIDMSSKSFIELLGRVLPEGSLKVKPQDSGH